MREPVLGANIRDAKVTLAIPHQFAPAARTQTGPDGKFVIPHVPPQQYRIDVFAPGFVMYRQSIDARDGKDIELGDIPLQVGMPDMIEVPTPRYPSGGLARFVYNTLDVTSFPSSIGPRRVEGKTSFQDYGILARKVGDNEALLERKDGSWSFRITVLERSESGIFVCFEDRGEPPATYHTQQVLWLVRPDNHSRLKAEETKTTFTDCPPFAK